MEEEGDNEGGEGDERELELELEELHGEGVWELETEGEALLSEPEFCW